MTGDELGGQTVTVYERERLGNREYRDSGVVHVWPGCSVQPDRNGERTVDGRVTDQRRWKLYGVPGLRANALAQCTVEPGPTDEHGRPLRLSFDGAAESHWDLDGTEDHVTAALVVS